MEPGNLRGALLLVALIVVLVSMLAGSRLGLSRKAGTLLLALGGTVLFFIGALLHP
ncbi:MAG TPA: hypothetical protein VMA31_15730 [Bryobacteraceae bacterium]|nr:hypothetical protein [Bryobacteraceae bacterium]